MERNCLDGTITEKKKKEEKKESTELKFKQPIQVNVIKIQNEGFNRLEHGFYVSVRPASGNKTYLGIMIGDAPLFVWGQYNKDRSEAEVNFHRNPAIFVPDLMKVVLGCESWWGKIEKPEDLQQISDADINNVWYVKALKAISK